jgi:hypothetical protein
MVESQAAHGRPPETLQRVRLAYLAVIAAHERVADLLAALGDQAGGREERQAAEEERARLARLHARVAAGDHDQDPPH